MVDNAGDAQTITHVSSIIPRATCIINNVNKGCAAAKNQALKLAKGRYVLVLNPDISFTKDTLANMVAHMDASPDVGVGSSVVRSPDGKLQESICRFPTLKDQLCIVLNIPSILRRNNWLDSYMMRDKDPLVTQDVDSISGAFMWIRHPPPPVGPFDERYVLGFEGVDYCKMVVDAGWKVQHFADVEITRREEVSSSWGERLQKERWIRRDIRKYVWKHDGFLSWFLLFVLAPLCSALAYVSVFASAGKRR